MNKHTVDFLKKYVIQLQSPNANWWSVAHAHCTRQGQGPGLALGTMDFCITLCTYILTRDRDREPFCCACACPNPDPGPGPVQYESLVPKSQKYQVQLSDILPFICSGQYETLVKIGNWKKHCHTHTSLVVLSMSYADEPHQNCIGFALK